MAPRKLRGIEMLGWEKSPLQQDPMSSQAADPRSRARLQRQKGSPGVGDVLSDVSGEEGDGARQLDDTHGGPYPDPLPKMHAVLLGQPLHVLRDELTVALSCIFLPNNNHTL